jgi:anti-sigma-K factor RskA
MLAQYPEARAELEAIELVLEQYANAQSVPPPPELKNRILDEIERTSRTLTPSVNNTMLRLFQAAAVLLLGAAVYFWYQQGETQAILEASRKQAADLQVQYEICTTSVEAERAIVNLLRNPQTRPIKMSNKVDSTQTPAYVFHNTHSDNCKAVLDVLALPAQPSGSYLQFWALVDGKPVSMGMIKADSTGLQTFPCVPDAAGFAVSIEDKPDGNQTPTVVLMLGT